MKRPDWIFVLAVSLVMAFPVAGQDPPKKYALLIGLNTYLAPSVAELKWAKDDVEALKSVLVNEQRYDDVISLINDDAERDDIVMNLYRLAARVREQDSFLLYFAGHGLRSKIGKTPTYWLTWDASIERLEVAGIRLTHLLEYVADIGARQKLVILDHCFSGDVVLRPSPPTTAPARDASAGVPALIDETTRGGIPRDVFNHLASTAGAGTLVISAARGFAFELESTKHGALTTVLLKALTTRDADTDRNGRLSVNELTKYIKTQVPILTENAQDPQFSTPGPTVNLDDWIVADNLKIGTPQANERARKYEGLLTKLYNVELLSYNEMTDGLAMVEVWLASFGTGRELAPHEVTAMKNFGELADDVRSPDERRAVVARSLIDYFYKREVHP